MKLVAGWPCYLQWCFEVRLTAITRLQKLQPSLNMCEAKLVQNSSPIVLSRSGDQYSPTNVKTTVRGCKLTPLGRISFWCVWTRDGGEKTCWPLIEVSENDISAEAQTPSMMCRRDSSWDSDSLKYCTVPYQSKPLPNLLLIWQGRQ